MDPEMVMSLTLVRYRFSTPEIRLLMRHVLGHAPSGRTIKRAAKSAGIGQSAAALAKGSRKMIQW
jgi:hypothetical protein